MLVPFTPASEAACPWLRSWGNNAVKTYLCFGSAGTAAISFAICTLVIDDQAAFLRSADRGFRRQGLILVLSISIAQMTTRQPMILGQFRRIPGVVAATESDRIPNGLGVSMTEVRRPGLSGPQPSLVFQQVAGDYFRTYGIPLLAGRLFDPAHGTDDAAHVSRGTTAMPAHLSTIISLKAVSSLGLASPEAALGVRFGTGDNDRNKLLTIVGVVDDVRFTSPREPVSPQFYTETTGGIGNAAITVRFSGVSADEMMRRLQAAWHRLAPDEPFRAQGVDDRLSAFYVPDQQRGRLFSAGAVLAIAIACLGLYGLAAFSTGQRQKEIGIRKVMGASTRDVLLMVVGQSTRPVLVAGLAAWPIAWAAMRSWLAGFDQRISLSPGYFLAATLAAVTIAASTVLGQAWHVARAEPGKALRHE